MIRNLVSVYSRSRISVEEAQVIQKMIQTINPVMWFEEDVRKHQDGFNLVVRIRVEDEGKVSISDRCLARIVLNLIRRRD